MFYNKKDIEGEIENITKNDKTQNLGKFTNLSINYKLYFFLKKAILVKGIIFYRMTPLDKILLVEFLKEDPKNIIGMCGDGSNDSGAIASADFGILIRNSKGVNLINSHFYTEDNSISCIELIIKNGRASLENFFIIIRFMFLYSFIQMGSVIILNYNKTDFNNSQFLFLDFVCAFLSTFFSSM